MDINALWAPLSGVPSVWAESLRLVSFRNHTDSRLQPGRQFNLISGPNGSGKTSVLDALHFLCVGRGFSAGQDQVYVHQPQANGFFLSGQFRDGDIPLQIECRYVPGEGKRLSFNGKDYERLSDHLGRLPAVAFYPSDIVLVWGFAGERRRYFDQMYSMLSGTYLQALRKYHKILEQRNAYLRQTRENRMPPDSVLLEVYNKELCEAASTLLQERAHFTENLHKLLRAFYSFLAGTDEEPSVSWTADITSASQLSEALDRHFDQELRLGITFLGPHRDDYRFELNGQPLKKSASQGQQKTFLAALKLSLIHMLSETLRKKPVVLLDDLFDKLDNRRVKALVEVLGAAEMQVFITDTSAARLLEATQGCKGEFRIFECENGTVKTGS